MSVSAWVKFSHCASLGQDPGRHGRPLLPGLQRGEQQPAERPGEQHGQPQQQHVEPGIAGLERWAGGRAAEGRTGPDGAFCLTAIVVHLVVHPEPARPLHQHGDRQDHQEEHPQHRRAVAEPARRRRTPRRPGPCTGACRAAPARRPAMLLVSASSSGCTTIWNDAITPVTTWKKSTGEIIGTVTCRNTRHRPAPSTTAASSSSGGTPCSAASVMTMPPPSPHSDTMTRA